MTKRIINLLLFLVFVLTMANGQSSMSNGQWSMVNGQGSPSPKYEVRAVWLTTIGGIDWPHSFNAMAQRKELIRTLDLLKKAGINTVLIQTRVRATTIYPSALEPWDGCLTGTPGRSPGYDPLQLCIDLCHERGMECHAWVVTIPVGKWNSMGCKRLREKYPKLIKRIGEEGYMDPEQAQTGDYLARICREIVSGYDVDGIHLDYIRYPETWKIKVNRQKGRDNITTIVWKISQEVKEEKPWVKLSCSPVGKYDDLRRYRSGGWNARTAVCQDAQEWLRAGLMDQLYPMMYFQGNNFYPFAIDWQENSYGCSVAGGLGIYFLDPREGTWKLDDVERQMYVLRQIGMGHCFFRAKFLNDNVKGIYDFVRRFNATPALVPPKSGDPKPVAPSGLRLNGNTLSWNPSAMGGQSSRMQYSHIFYNIYASEDYPVDITRAENLVATRLSKTSAVVGNASGRYNYAVTAVNRYCQESTPVQLLINAGPIRHLSSDLRQPAPIALTAGHTIRLPQNSLMDASYVIIEGLDGRQVAARRYASVISIEGIPDGIYQLRTIGRKGRNHRIGFFSIKRSAHERR